MRLSRAWLPVFVTALAACGGVVGAGASGASTSPSTCDLAAWERTHPELSGVVPVESLDVKPVVTGANLRGSPYPTSAERGFDARIQVAVVIDTTGRVALAEVRDQRIRARDLSLFVTPEVEADFRRSALAMARPTLFAVPRRHGRPTMTVVCIPVSLTGG